MFPLGLKPNTSLSLKHGSPLQSSTFSHNSITNLTSRLTNINCCPEVSSKRFSTRYYSNHQIFEGSGEKHEFEVSSTDSGKRLDAQISKQLSLTRRYIQHLIETNHVLVNGKPMNKKSSKLRLGDKVTLQTESRSTPHDVHKAEDTSPLKPNDEDSTHPLQDEEILYEDEDILVINKPAGVAVHAGRSISHRDTLVMSAKQYCNSDRSIRGKLPLHVGFPQRLDKDTSGVIVCAKNMHSLHQLNHQFASRKTKKVYCALCSVPLKFPTDPIFEIDSPLQRKGESMYSFGEDESMDEDIELRNSPTKIASSIIKILGSNQESKLMLVSVIISSGRTHQIRTHLASAGYPVCGDLTYLDRDQFSRRISERAGISRMMLHSHKLGIFHPISQTPMLFTAPIQGDMYTSVTEHFTPNEYEYLIKK